MMLCICCKMLQHSVPGTLSSDETNDLIILFSHKSTDQCCFNVLFSYKICLAAVLNEVIVMAGVCAEKTAVVTTVGDVSM